LISRDKPRLHRFDEKSASSVFLARSRLLQNHKILHELDAQLIGLKEIVFPLYFLLFRKNLKLKQWWLAKLKQWWLAACSEITNKKPLRKI